MHSTKQRLLESGMTLLLEHGYNNLGLQEILDATGIPKGSFYHHFGSKENFALQVVDRYMDDVHAELDATLLDAAHPPLDRVQNFFNRVQARYVDEGNLGCLLGTIGHELSTVNETFRRKIEECLAAIAQRIAACLEEAQQQGDVPASADPETMANILVDCWEGAALRMRLVQNTTPLEAVLDFYFDSVTAA